MQVDAVQDVIKMLEAGVSKEVVKAYIENSPPFALTADGVIALKKHSVPDDLATALVKRMVDLRAGHVSPDGSGSHVFAAGESGAGRPQNARRFDPESYEFWWYHYAYPRALSYANERLYASFYPSQIFRPVPFGFP
jgi:hypothetical protein